MVTKRAVVSFALFGCSVLAKIHMVTKPRRLSCSDKMRSVLAKIHMVTKPQKYGSTFLNVIEY